MTALYAALVATAWLGLCLYATPQRISPDGRYYLAAGEGKRVPRPFHLRWLLPSICRASFLRWKVATFAGIVSAAVLVALLASARGLSPGRSVLASALFVGLPMVGNTLERPVLVDGPALALAAGSALLAVEGYGWLAALVALVGGATKEHVPIFAAAAAWSLWPLLGLAAPLVARALLTAAPSDHASQLRPIGYAREKQSPRVRYAILMLMPWGLCLAALWSLSLPVVASLGLSYGLLFVASDSTRIYQWAALPVCVAAAGVIPDGWLVPAAVAHLWWPWGGEV